MSFNDNIRNWVTIDNKIKLLNEKLRDLREQRTNLCEDIYVYADDNNLQNHTIQISDGKLKFGKTKQTAPITLKYLEKCLGELISDEAQVEHIINYIKENREIKIITDIKRYSDN
tara:strand:+ start:223 stop:567 length:345 start_codon:yes stop_codon:yes gene_type:complete